MTSRLTRLAAAVALPAALALSACSSGTTTTTTSASASASQSSAASTQAETSSATSETAAASSEAPAGDEKDAFIAALKEGQAALKSAHMDMVVGSGAQGMKATSDIELTGGNTNVSMNMDLAGMALKMLAVDGVTYMSGFPGMAAGKWAKLDPSSTIGKQMSEAMTQNDPTKMYDGLEKGITKVSKSGTETIDGVETTVYDLTVDPAAMGAGASGAKDIAYKIWVDGDNHMRKMTADISGTALTITMNKFNEPVSIKAPAAADLVEMPKM